MDIVATPGAANANSFATELQFIAHAAESSSLPTGTSVSGSACTDDEKKALALATRMLKVLPFDGTVVSSTQKLPLPRAYLKRADAPYTATSTDIYWSDSAIPDPAVEATCELALEILRSGTTRLDLPHKDANLKRSKLDVIEKEYFDLRDQLRGLDRFPTVKALIAPLLKQSGTGTLDLVRV